MAGARWRTQRDQRCALREIILRLDDAGMKATVVTPSYRQSEWLRLCVASVADQEGDVEHIVQDACSDDGTQDWLAGDSRVRAYVEKDEGMYDAVNRGLKRSSGEVCSYLNCDEQYLPGALRRVVDEFEKDPDLDVLFGDVVVVGRDGEFKAYRKSVPPREPVVFVNPSLPILTCATFFRRRVMESQGLWFDRTWRALGDAEWLLRVLRAGLKMRCLRDYTSIFAITGANLSGSGQAAKEGRALRRRAPGVYRLMYPCIRLEHWGRKWAYGCYRQEPFDYSIYTMQSPGERVGFSVDRPSHVYPREA